MDDRLDGALPRRRLLAADPLRAWAACSVPTPMAPPAHPAPLPPPRIGVPECVDGGRVAPMPVQFARPMSAELPVVLIEGVLVLGGAVLFGWWQLRDVKRDQEAAARRKAEAAKAAAKTSDPTDAAPE